MKELRHTPCTPAQVAVTMRKMPAHVAGIQRIGGGGVSQRTTEGRKTMKMKNVNFIRHSRPSYRIVDVAYR